MTDTILKCISNGVFTVDLNWKITSFNRAAEEITGIPSAEAIGKKCNEIFKSSMCEKECPIRATLATKKPVAVESITILNKEGNSVEVSVSSSVLVNDNGKVIGGVETFRDMREIAVLRRELEDKYKIGDFISRAGIMKPILDIIPIISASRTNVLITGETGTGKEVLAKTIHNSGTGRGKPFLAVNCGALPETLLESELFGYKKGAFTGADKDKPGRFALAGEGTLFLDEIGDLSPMLQVKLLRVLQERTFEPLGSIKSEPLRARIITATNHSLEKKIEEKKFRMDLYYRINVIHIELPPLKERLEDIPYLVHYFVDKYNVLHHKNIRNISPDFLSELLERSWPGNVRELENIIERAFVLCTSDTLTPNLLPQKKANQKEIVIKEETPDWRESAEKEIFKRVLHKNKYNVAQAASDLKMHRATLYRKLKKYQLAY